MAAARRDSGEIAEADRLLTDAIRIDEQLAAANPGVFSHQTRLAAAYGVYAQSLQAQGRLIESLAWYRKSLAILSSLSAAHPENGLLLSDLASTNHNAAIVARATGDLTLAREFYENSARIGSKAVALSPGDESVACDAGDGWVILAQFLSFQHEYPAAKMAAQKATALMDKWKAGGGDETLRRVARASSYLGLMQTELDEPAELTSALANFATAQEITGRLAAKRPASDVSHLDLAWIDLNRATVLRLLDHLPEAAILLDDAIKRASVLSGGENNLPAPFIAERGVLRLDQGQPQAAGEDLELAFKHLKISSGDTIAAETVASIRSPWMLALIALGDLQSALAFAIAPSETKAPQPMIITLRYAEALSASGKEDEASAQIRTLVAAASPAQKAWLRRIAERDRRILAKGKHPLQEDFWEKLDE